MRILLLEDHPIVRAGCRRLLESLDGVEIREAASATDGLRITREFRPDTIILDLKLPDGSGLALMTQLLSNEPVPKIIVFSMYEEPTFAARALEAGARGYITKNDNPDALVQAVEKVGAGGVFLTALMSEKLALMATVGTADGLHGLSAREIAALELLGQGRTLSEIGNELKISYRTSASLVAQVKSKLNIASNAALIRWAVEHKGLRPGADAC
ncbi:MAG: response regulator transcription factor [Acetobacteraceae bacterium]|nr:response regulator transcription factor [Acetobacteraceae bacterium]